MPDEPPPGLFRWYRHTLRSHMLVVDVSEQAARFVCSERTTTAKYDWICQWLDQLIADGDEIAMEQVRVVGSQRSTTLTEYARERQRIAA